MSSALFHKYRPRYGDIDVSMMMRLKELEEENCHLRRCTPRRGSRLRSGPGGDAKKIK